MDALAVPFLLVVLPFLVCGGVLAGFIVGWTVLDFINQRGGGRWLRSVGRRSGTASGI